MCPVPEAQRNSTYGVPPLAGHCADCSLACVASAALTKGKVIFYDQERYIAAALPIPGGVLASLRPVNMPSVAPFRPR